MARLTLCQSCSYAFTGFLFFVGTLLTIVALTSYKGEHRNTTGTRLPWDAELMALHKSIGQFVPVPLTSAAYEAMSETQQTGVAHIVRAAEALNSLYREQMWSGNADLRHLLYLREHATEAPWKFRYELERAFFDLNAGPWNRLEDNILFLRDPDIKMTVPGTKPLGSNFYPEAMTLARFESWVNTLDDAGREDALSHVHVVVLQDGRYQALPYSEVYEADLRRCGDSLRAAADVFESSDPELSAFLIARALAFSENSYHDSDVMWLQLDSDVHLTIGPYESYDDQLVGIRRSFEAYVGIRNRTDEAAYRLMLDRAPDIQSHLPIPAYMRPPLAPLDSSVEVVDLIFNSGGAAAGVQTTAFNLPNDADITLEYGTKRVILKNVQEAKFEHILTPIAEQVLHPDLLPLLSYEAFALHVFAHELCHGIGPHVVYRDEQPTDETVSEALGAIHHAIEEAKADICGLHAVLYLIDNQLVTEFPSREQFFATFLASAFRSIRFGAHEAHGQGVLLQLNYLENAGAVTRATDGKWSFDHQTFPAAVASLTATIMTSQGNGNAEALTELLDTFAVIGDDLQAQLEEIDHIPVDIYPLFEDWRHEEHPSLSQ